MLSQKINIKARVRVLNRIFLFGISITTTDTSISSKKGIFHNRFKIYKLYLNKKQCKTCKRYAKILYIKFEIFLRNE